MFFEMRFDLGTLDSGERSLPFGLLVFKSQNNNKWPHDSFPKMKSWTAIKLLLVHHGVQLGWRLTYLIHGLSRSRIVPIFYSLI